MALTIGMAGLGHIFAARSLLAAEHRSPPVHCNMDASAYYFPQTRTLLSGHIPVGSSWNVPHRSWPPIMQPSGTEMARLLPHETLNPPLVES